MDERITKIFTDTPEVAKQFYRASRSEYMNKISSGGIRIPITLNNLVFAVNIYFVQDKSLLKITRSMY
jgi:hypothetical protein